MTYKSYFLSVISRIIVLGAALFTCAYAYLEHQTYLLVGGLLATIIIFFNLYKFLIRRFREMDDFFESVKYRDFSRFFVEQRGPQDIRELHKGFNAVNKTIRTMNSERQMQFVYLQKILELVEVGIIAYDINTGKVLWVNDSFLEILDFPSFKNINFVESRRPQLFEKLFDSYYKTPQAVKLQLHEGQVKVLLSDSVFQMEEDSFKLLVVQNIDQTLDKNESDAWKKLLSVMTHEIMNSIAPIASLAETLQYQVKASMESPEEQNLSLEDLSEGIQSIKKRSEGLMKFAKTYRSLNKITQLNLENVSIKELFKNIEALMRPSLEQEAINLHFKQENAHFNLEIDSYLIEQVLINLILNAIAAVKGTANPRIDVAAHKHSRGNTAISVSDNGAGIPNEILENIFVPFFSTKKSGSGVGLSLCKQIMSLHQGSIQVNSEVGKGTQMTLIF